jgi:RimJ/RimL family protein N-acetyltransferase
MFQIRLLDAAAGTAEWGFVLGAPYWGTGLFRDGARLVVDFAFETLGLRRLEARACVANGRGSGALRKVGAVREQILQGSFERAGQHLDQGLWTIVREDWLWTMPPAGGVKEWSN